MRMEGRLSTSVLGLSPAVERWEPEPGRPVAFCEVWGE